MIEAIQTLGKHVISKEGLNLSDFDHLVEILTENPASTEKYKKVLKIQLKRINGELEFSRVDTSDYDSTRINEYLYRRGFPSGTDYTSTTRITVPLKTFHNKIMKWYNQDFSGFDLTDNERELLASIRDVLEENKDTILTQITEIHEGVQRDKLNAILTVELVDGYNTYLPGDLEVYKKILVKSALAKYYKKYNTSSIAENNTCSVCGEVSPEVYGFVSTYAFYTVDKPGMVSGGFDQSKAWKNYPVCRDCALLLEQGKQYLEKYASFNFYGFNYLLIPKPLGKEKNTEIYDILTQYHEEGKNVRLTENYENLLEGNKREILQVLSEKENKFQCNMMIYKATNSEYKILKYIEGIFPSDLKRLFKAKKKVDSDRYIKETMITVWDKNKPVGQRVLTFDFGCLWYFMKQIDENHSKYFLDIVSKVLKGRRVSYPFVLSRIVQRIRKAFANNQNLKEPVMKGMCSLLFLNKLDLLIELDESEIMSEKIRDLISGSKESSRVEAAETIFKHYPRFFKGDSEKATFLVGVLSQLLMDIQYRDRKATPFRSKLQGLKLDEKKVKSLLPAIQNKLEEYESNYYRDLESLASEYFVQAQNDWKLSRDEVSFYFALGMNLSRYFKTKGEVENE